MGNYAYSYRQTPNYSTAAETPSVYGRSRTIDQIAIHHWGDPNTNPTFEGVINVLCNPAREASAHYVAEAGRVCQLLNEADTSWATNSANPYTISIECNPRASDGDFDTIGQLIADIWKRHGRKGLIRHKDIVSTACPGRYTDQLPRLVNIANSYLAPPLPEWKRNLQVAPGAVFTMYANRDGVPLQDLVNGNTIKTFPKNTPFAISGITNVGPESYHQTQYAFDNNQPNGINLKYLSRTPIEDPKPTPPPPPPPKPPEWEVNAKNYPTAITLYANKETRLVDIDTGKPSANVEPYVKGKVFDSITRETTVGGQRYFISKYSADRNIWKGFKAEDMDTTPQLPPAPKPNDPTPDDVAGTDRIGALEKEVSGIKALLKQITDFLSGIFKAVFK